MRRLWGKFRIHALGSTLIVAAAMTLESIAPLGDDLTIMLPVAAA